MSRGAHGWRRDQRPSEAGCPSESTPGAARRPPQSRPLRLVPRSNGRTYAGANRGRSSGSARCPPRRERSSSSSRLRSFHSQGNLEGERRPLPELALDPDAAAVHLDELLGDAQPESTPAELRGDRRVGLPKLAEHGGELVTRTHDAGIGDAVDEGITP